MTESESGGAGTRVTPDGGANVEESATESSRTDETSAVTLSLQSITRGASLSLVGKVVANGLGLLTNLLLTRGLGAGLYGIYTYGKTLLSVFSIFARLGAGRSVLRFLPKYEAESAVRNAILGLAYGTALCASVVVGAVLYAAAPILTSYTLDEPLLTAVLRILAVVLPFNTVANITNSVFRGIERIEFQILTGNLLTPGVRVLAIGVGLLLGYSLTGVVAATAIGSVVVVLLALALLYSKTGLQPTLAGSTSRTREFYNYSVPLTFKDVGSYLYSRVDILMVGFVLAGNAVGIYKIAVILSALLVLPLNAFNQLFPPVASRLYSNDKLDELESTYATVTRWTLTVALVPALGLGIYGDEVLAIFGSEFTAGGTVLLLFTVAQLTNCAVGPSGYVLMMTDHQYLNLANQWVLGILNVGLNYLLLTEFGFIGAALATASVLAGINVVRVVQVWYTEGLVPYSRQYWKPIAAGGLAGLVMAGWHLLVSDYVLLVVGGATGGLVFAGSLWLFGIEQDDREFFEQVV